VRITVRVPATSANLGPGFDCFGLALDLCNEVTVDTEAEPGVTWEGEGARELPIDGSDMVSRAMAHALVQQRRSQPDAELPAVALHGVNRIPLERGLGSSSAAAVAGIALVQAWFGRIGPAGEQPLSALDVFSLAADLEGHPDNAAAATHGGFTIVADRVVRRLDPHPDLDPVVLVPDHLRMPTGDARSVLASAVSRQQAVFNIGHAALAVVAFTQDPTLLLVALHDRLHEDGRAELVPESASLLADLRQRQIPACLSGAGPSLLAFEREGHTVGDLPNGWRAIRPGVRAKGLEVFVEG
jgi:homoserine kinase